MSDDNDDDDSGVAAAQPTQQAPAANAPYNVPQAIISGLGQRGVSPQAAYGVVGSFMGESGKGLNASAINAGDGSDGSDSIGFGQWNGIRAKNLKATAASMGLDPSDPKAQVAHYFNELDGNYASGNYGSVLSNLQNANSVAQGNDIHTRQYEVPANVNAQVAARLGYGQQVAAAAANGSLGKFGSFGPSQNVAGAPGTGALGADSMSGNNLGALYQLAAQQAPQQESIGERMTRFGAALAGISSPAQAQAMLANIPKQPAQQSRSDQLIKALQLQAALKSANTPTPIKTVVAPNGQGVIQQNPDGSPGAYMPYPAAAQDNSAPQPKSTDITNYNKQVGYAGQNAQGLDSLYKLRDQVVNDPTIVKQLDGTSPISSYMNNFLGESNDMSQFQKELARQTNTYVTNLQATIPGGRSTNDLRKMEMSSIMPVGASNDAETIRSSIQAMIDKTQNNYGTNIGSVNTYKDLYKDNLPFANPMTGKAGNVADYDNANRSRWADVDKTTQAGLPAFLAAHAARSNGGAPAPLSRVQQILNNQGVQ